MRTELSWMRAPKPALWDDKLEPFAVQAVTRDDNIFRLAAPELDDTYRSTSLGLRLDLPMSRQRLRGALELSRVRYDRFGELDFGVHSARALWEWGLGDDLKGKLGYTQRRALASLASIVEGVPSRIPNVLTTRRAFAAGEAMLGARWRLARGSLPNPQLIANVPVDNSYRQREAGLLAEWSPGVHARLRAYSGRVRREYDERPERDFDGELHELALDWTPTDKLTLRALAQRDISDTEEIHVSFVLAECFALNLDYRPSVKTVLGALLETSDRRYLGEAGRSIVPREHVDAAGLVASFQPLRQVTLLLALRRETRSAEFTGGDYEASIVSLGVRLAL